MSAPQSSGINPPTVEPIKIPSQIVDRMGADTRPRTGPRAKAARGAWQNGRLAKKARHSRRAPSLGRNAVVRRHHNLRPIRLLEDVPQFTQWRPKFVGRRDRANAVPPKLSLALINNMNLRARCRLLYQRFVFPQGYANRARMRGEEDAAEYQQHRASRIEPASIGSCRASFAKSLRGSRLACGISRRR